MSPRPASVAVRRHVKAAGLVEGMCDWKNPRFAPPTESHEDFHFGYICPFDAMAAVLRGEQDPRNAFSAGPPAPPADLTWIVGTCAHLSSEAFALSNAVRRGQRDADLEQLAHELARRAQSIRRAVERLVADG